MNQASSLLRSLILFFMLMNHFLSSSSKRLASYNMILDSSVSLTSINFSLSRAQFLALSSHFQTLFLHISLASPSWDSRDAHGLCRGIIHGSCGVWGTQCRHLGWQNQAVDDDGGADREQGWRREMDQTREREDWHGREAVDLVELVNLERIWDRTAWASLYSPHIWAAFEGVPVSTDIWVGYAGSGWMTFSGQWLGYLPGRLREVWGVQLYMLLDLLEKSSCFSGCSQKNFHAIINHVHLEWAWHWHPIFFLFMRFQSPVNQIGDIGTTNDSSQNIWIDRNFRV